MSPETAAYIGVIGAVTALIAALTPLLAELRKWRKPSTTPPKKRAGKAPD